MTVSFHDNVRQFSFIVFHGDMGFMNQGIGVFPFCVGDMNFFPIFDPIDLIHHVLSPPQKRDEPPPLLVQLRGLGIVGELGIEDKGRLKLLADLIPEEEEAHDLLIGFFPLDVGSSLENQLREGILDKQGERPLQSLFSGSGPMLLERRFIAKAGNRMEVQVDDILATQPQPSGLPDEGLLQSQEMGRVQTAGVGRHGHDLSKHMEFGKQARAMIKGVVIDVGMALGTDKFEAEKGEEVPNGRDDLAGRQACGRQACILDDIRDLEPFKEGDGEEDTGPIAGIDLLAEFGEPDSFGDRSDLGTFDGSSDLELCSPGEFEKPFFGQNAFHGANGDSYTSLGEELGDLAGWQIFCRTLASMARRFALPSGQGSSKSIFPCAN